jgi:hypothetical protein
MGHHCALALELWAATKELEDLLVLRAWQAPDVFANETLVARLRRADITAIPALIDRIEGSENAHQRGY